MTSQTLSWGVLVGEMLIRRTEISRIAPDLFPETLPGVRATDEDLAAAEERLGFTLDEQHTSLLREGDGWPDVFAYGDILPARELGRGPRWKRATAMIDASYEGGALPGFPPRDTIYPIHVCERAVFVIDRAGPATDGGHPVYWLSDELLGQWPNTYGYWLAGLTLLDRLRARLEDDSR